MDEQTVRFGDKEYPLTSPKIPEGLEWRAKLKQVLGTLEVNIGPTIRVDRSLAAQEDMIELVASFPGLGVSKDFITEHADEAQLMDAYSKILVVAFRPWLELQGTLKSLRAALNWPPIDPAAGKPQPN
jgi:hypothetical protein